MRRLSLVYPLILLICGGIHEHTNVVSSFRSISTLNVIQSKHSTSSFFAGFRVPLTPTSTTIPPYQAVKLARRRAAAPRFVQQNEDSNSNIETEAKNEEERDQSQEKQSDASEEHEHQQQQPVLSANAPVVGMRPSGTNQTGRSNQVFIDFLGKMERKKDDDDDSREESKGRGFLSKLNPFSRKKIDEEGSQATEDLIESGDMNSNSTNVTSVESNVDGKLQKEVAPQPLLAVETSALQKTPPSLTPVDNSTEPVMTEEKKKPSLLQRLLFRRSLDKPTGLTEAQQREEEQRLRLTKLVEDEKTNDSLTLRRLFERETLHLGDGGSPTPIGEGALQEIPKRRERFSLLRALASSHGLRGKVKYVTVLVFLLLVAPIPKRFTITDTSSTTMEVAPSAARSKYTFGEAAKGELQLVPTVPKEVPRKEESAVESTTPSLLDGAPTQFAGSGRAAVVGEPRIASSPEGRSYISTFVADAVRKIGPSVIRIDTERFVENPGFQQPRQPQSYPFFGLEDLDSDEPQRPVEQGQGSGIIFSSDGLVLTNAHVVEGASRVTVTLTDGRRYLAEVKGSDDMVDLAVLQLIPKEIPEIDGQINNHKNDMHGHHRWEGAPLPVAPLGNSDTVQVGEWALAIGNPVGLDNTVTIGIVSAIKRSSSEVGIPQKKVAFIQTDAAINPGNSGGPLVNEHGEIIGINTCIRANAEGIGFAIPINKAKSIMYQLADGKSVQHGYIGIVMTTVTPDFAKQNNANPNSPAGVIPEVHGALVMRVMSNTPASECGLRRFDVVLEIGGKRVRNAAEAQGVVDSAVVGEQLELKILRGEKEMTLLAKPGDLAQKLKEAKEKERQQQQQQPRGLPPGIFQSPGEGGGRIYIFPIPGQ